MQPPTHYTYGPGQWLQWMHRRLPDRPLTPLVSPAVFVAHDNGRNVVYDPREPSIVVYWRAEAPHTASWYIGPSAEDILGETQQWPMRYNPDAEDSILVTNVWSMPRTVVNPIGVTMVVTTMDDFGAWCPVGMTAVFDSVNGRDFPAVEAGIRINEKMVYVNYVWKTGKTDNFKYTGVYNEHGDWDSFYTQSIPTMDANTGLRYTVGMLFYGDHVKIIVHAPTEGTRQKYVFDIDVPRHVDDTVPRLNGEILPFTIGASVHEMQIHPCSPDKEAFLQLVDALDAKYSAT